MSEPTTTVYLDTDEFYPYYNVKRKKGPYTREITLRNDVVDRYLEAEQAFLAAYSELREEIAEVREREENEWGKANV